MHVRTRPHVDPGANLLKSKVASQSLSAYARHVKGILSPLRKALYAGKHLCTYCVRLFLTHHAFGRHPSSKNATPTMIHNSIEHDSLRDRVGNCVILPYHIRSLHPPWPRCPRTIKLYYHIHSHICDTAVHVRHTPWLLRTRRLLEAIIGRDDSNMHRRPPLLQTCRRISVSARYGVTL